MSVFNNGGGTLKSTNRPAALVELAHLLNEAERSASTVDNTIENIDITYGTNARVTTITASLPIGYSINGNGQPVLTATNYLGAAPFNGGAGDLKSATLPAAFVELAHLVAKDEQAILPTPVNNVTITTDLEGLTMAITANLPFIPTLDANGKPVQTITDYIP